MFNSKSSNTFTKSYLPVLFLAFLARFTSAQAPHKYYGVGTDSLLYYRDSLDAVWVGPAAQGGQDMIAVRIMGDGTILGVGVDYSLYTRADLNSPWVVVPNSTGVTAISVGRSDGKILGVSSSNDYIWYLDTTDGTSAWQQIPLSGTVDDVDVHDDGRMFVVDELGVWYRSDSLSSSSWTHVATAPNDLINISVMDNNEFLGVRANGRLYTSADEGVTWAEVQYSAPSYHKDMLYVAVNRHYVPSGNASGDPHFVTFGQTAFDYHAECDSLLMGSSGFASGLGLTVHVRTTRVDAANLGYSYISGAALQLGRDVVEVELDGSIIVNGDRIPKDEKVGVSEMPSAISGFPIVKTLEGSKKKIVQYVLSLGDEKAITIRSNIRTGMMYVNMEGNFPDSYGLLGNEASGKALVGRDGTDLTNDWVKYGESWQVLQTEQRLFQKPRHPQHPAKCIYKEQKKSNLRRRLMDTRAVVSAEAAAGACAKFHGVKREFCIKDVIATGDMEVAEDVGAYA